MTDLNKLGLKVVSAELIIEADSINSIMLAGLIDEIILNIFLVTFLFSDELITTIWVEWLIKLQSSNEDIVVRGMFNAVEMLFIKRLNNVWLEISCAMNGTGFYMACKAHLIWLVSNLIRFQYTMITIVMVGINLS